MNISNKVDLGLARREIVLKSIKVPKSMQRLFFKADRIMNFFAAYF